VDPLTRPSFGKVKKSVTDASVEKLENLLKSKTLEMAVQR